LLPAVTLGTVFTVLVMVLLLNELPPDVATRLKYVVTVKAPDAYVVAVAPAMVVTAELKSDTVDDCH